MIESESVVYRAAKQFPPGDDHFTPLSRQGDRRQPTADPHKRASTGLSSYTTIAALKAQMDRTPAIGTIIVKYTFAAGSDWSLEHLVGVPEHFTIFGDPHTSTVDFVQTVRYLDSEWFEIYPPPE